MITKSNTKELMNVYEALLKANAKVNVLWHGEIESLELTAVKQQIDFVVNDYYNYMIKQERVNK